MRFKGRLERIRKAMMFRQPNRVKKMTLVEDFLRKNSIPYRLLPHQKPAFTVEDAVRERGVKVDEMVKSILLVDKNKRYCLACIPGDKQVDPQRVSALLSFKRMSFASKDEIALITGHPLGAVCPLLLKQSIPIVFDEEIRLKNKVNISAGIPTLGVELSSADLIKLVNPMEGKIIK